MNIEAAETATAIGKSDESSTVKRVTWIGLIINLLLAGAKCSVGILASSQALVADAVHSLSDSATDIVVLVGVKYWSKPADKSHPHGHQRIETLIVAGIGLSLFLVALGLIYNALMSLRNHDDTIPGWTAFGAALSSIIIKELLYQYTARAGRRVKSSALIANAWHHRSDSISSIPAALAVLGVKLCPGYGFLDHIGAIVVG
ncbi:MAG: cation transporter, partial [Planctomycetes bacterium]|nr:cation transporter [Planctomycetota bacterium]